MMFFILFYYYLICWNTSFSYSFFVTESYIWENTLASILDSHSFQEKLIFQNKTVLLVFLSPSLSYRILSGSKEK